jgi:hypothetical protein
MGILKKFKLTAGKVLGVRCAKHHGPRFVLA